MYVSQCIYVHNMCAVPSGQKRYQIPWNRVTDGSEPSGECWKSNLGLLQEQPLLLTPEPFL